MKQDTLVDIERAIETVRLFNEQKYAGVDDSLEKSLDLLKVYTSAFSYRQKGTPEEKLLAKRVLDTAKGYNEFVRKAYLEPSTISGILKHFLQRVAGKKRYVAREIHIPAYIESEPKPAHKITHQKEIPSSKIFSVLQSVQRNSDADYSMPKQTEVDLFRNKSITLLLDQIDFAITLTDALELTQKSPIAYNLEEGAYLLSDNIMHLSQKMCPFPGIDIEISGALQRDTYHPLLAIPLRQSFQLKSHIFQTGFPHPSQYVGFALHEKLLPACILRPEMCPKFAEFSQKMRQLAENLLPKGALFKKAKELLEHKRKLFANDKKLQAHLKTLLKMLFPSFIESLSFDELSHKIAAFNTCTFVEPYICLQEEWLLKQNKKVILSPIEECTKILQQSFVNESLFGSAAISLYLMQLSEHLHFIPKPLNQFERTVVTALFRQQLIFSYELNSIAIQDLPKHLEEVLIDEVNLFKNTPSNDPFTKKARELAQELFQYYY